MREIRHLCAALILLLLWRPAAPCGWAAEKPAAKGDYFVYIGTYTQKDSKGIYCYRLQTGSGQVTPIRLAAETSNPSFLAVDSSGRFLYAANEISNYQGQRSGSVSAFAIDPKSGALRLLNTVPSRGGGAVYVTVDRTGRNVLVSNYGGGSVAVLPVKEDGSLAEASAFVQHTGSSGDGQRPSRPRAHSINVSPDNRFAIAADLGLDQLLVYQFDAGKGSLAANTPAFFKTNPGAGPRSLAFHPDGKFAYALTEKQNTVIALAYDAEGGLLRELETISSLPPDFTATSYGSEVQVHPSGRYLYAANRLHDSIAVFAIDARRGTLTPFEWTSTQGKYPRHFGIDPSGSYLIAANQNSHNVVIFRIDAKTGRLTPTGQSLDVNAPACVKFVAVE